MRAAGKLALKIKKRVCLLAKMPEIGSPVEDTTHDGLRELIVGNYRVIYKYDGKECNIRTFVRAEQDLDRYIS